MFVCSVLVLFAESACGRNAFKFPPDCETSMSAFTFAVNFVSTKPSSTGEFYALLNPIGTAPAYQRLDGTKSVTWQIWFGETKAAEYSAMLEDAKNQPNHRLFVTAEFDVQVKPGLKPGQQTNRLVFKTKAVKEVRPVLVVPTQDELA